MSLPTHYEFHKPILEYIRDGRDYNMKSIRDEMVKNFSITESETREMLPSGRQTRLMNRIYWAKAYLKLPFAKLFEIKSIDTDLFNEYQDE